MPGGDAVFGPGSSTFATESPTGLTNISELDINLVSFAGGATFAVDNIVLSAGAVPEPSTWAMMLLGFIGLSFAGYRKARPARSVS